MSRKRSFGWSRRFGRRWLEYYRLHPPAPKKEHAWRPATPKEQAANG